MSRWWRKRTDGPTVPDTAGVPTQVELINEDNFGPATSGRLTAVDFWAPWCGPCRVFAPVFEEAAGRFGGQVSFGKCNLDENGALAALLQIQSIPTVILFGPDGSELNRISGSTSRRQLERMVTGALEQAGP